MSSQQLAPSVPTLGVSAFSVNFLKSHERFLLAAEAAGAEVRLSEIPHSLEAPPLSIAYARLGPANAQNVLVHLCGVHGVEHLAGSAVQLEILNSRPRLPPNTAVILVHGVNPTGAQMNRRFEALSAGNLSPIREDGPAGVDNNRNLATGRGNGMGDEYRKEYMLLNPRISELDLAMSELARRMTDREEAGKILTAAAIGQYEDPTAIFFGGTEPTASVNSILQNLPLLAPHAVNVLALDLHTGLGENGKDVLISIDARLPAENRSVRDFLNSSVGLKIGQAEKVVPYFNRVQGSMATVMRDTFPAAIVEYLAQEIGTMPLSETLKAIIVETSTFARGGTAEERERAGNELRDAFIPRDEEWRLSTIKLGTELFYHSLRYFAPENG